jgi:hypothetical protein
MAAKSECIADRHVHRTLFSFDKSKVKLIIDFGDRVEVIDVGGIPVVSEAKIVANSLQARLLRGGWPCIDFVELI